MLRMKKILLRQVIDRQFGIGINKIDLLNAISNFIDDYYPTSPPTTVYTTKRQKSIIMNDLILDIKDAGGLTRWKKQLVTLNSPVIGKLLPPQKKKHSKPHQN